MLPILKVKDVNANEMWILARTLEPIYRTLVSPGFEVSLKEIEKVLPGMTIKKYASGKKVFDWTIPDSWTVKEAYLEDSKGHRLFDFKKQPLFVGPYSISFSGRINKEELYKHLYSLPHLPDALPLCPAYYVRDWRLGVPHKFKESLKDEEYFVHIDSEFKPGYLCIGEKYLPGETDQEILFSTYLCHPTTANDNMSGVVVCTELFKMLSTMPRRRYSYRLIIIPETIGSITYLYHHQKEIKKLVGAYAVTCCGDGGGITFKKSFAGDSLLDRAGIKVISDRKKNDKIKEYIFTGSDERQFNAPGFRIPAPTIMRTPPSEFPEYHSSFDTLDCISPKNLADTLQFILDVLFIVDNNAVYKNLYKTEPFLTGYGIFKQVHVGNYGVFKNSEGNIDPGQLNQIVIHETDGKQDLLRIAEKHGCYFKDLKSVVEAFEKAGLVKKDRFKRRKK